METGVRRQAEFVYPGRGEAGQVRRLLILAGIHGERRWQARRRDCGIARVPVRIGAGHEAGCGEWSEMVAARAACGAVIPAGKRTADGVAGGERAVFQNLFGGLSRWREKSAPGTGSGTA